MAFATFKLESRLTSFFAYSPEPSHPSRILPITSDPETPSINFDSTNPTTSTLTVDELRAQYPLHFEIATTKLPSVAQIICSARREPSWPAHARRERRHADASSCFERKRTRSPCSIGVWYLGVGLGTGVRWGPDVDRYPMEVDEYDDSDGDSDWGTYTVNDADGSVRV